MERYEQLEFDVTKELNCLKESRQQCYDYNRNEIKEGDYVVAKVGKAKQLDKEGLVREIFYADDGRPFIKIVTYGGKTVDAKANPLFYEVAER